MNPIDIIAAAQERALQRRLTETEGWCSTKVGVVKEQRGTRVLERALTGTLRFKTRKSPRPEAGAVIDLTAQVATSARP